jgi:hypothetical protein
VVAHDTVDGKPYVCTLDAACGAIVKAKIVGLDPRYGLMVDTGHGEALVVRDNQRLAV